MAKKTNLESGFLFLYDWLPVLESLPAKEVKALLLALIARQRENRPLPPFSNPLTANYARMIEPCIKRRLDGAAAAKRAENDADPLVCGGVGGGVGGAVAPLPPKRNKEKESEGKKSEDKRTETPSLFPDAPEGGDIAPARGADGGATERAEKEKKKFFGKRAGSRTSFGRQKTAKNDAPSASSFDVDEFFQAALAATYGEPRGD